jgi:hypothetical protein
MKYRWGLAVVLCLPVVAWGQAPRNDKADQNKLLVKVAADKMEAQVGDALAEARKLAVTDPAKALTVLKTTLSQLEADTALTDARRASLIRTVKDRIQALPGNALDRTPKGELKTAPDQTAEQRLARSLEAIKQLQKDGKNAEARRMAAELAKTYPDNPAVQAALRMTAAADNIATGKDNKADSEKRAVGTLTNVDQSARIPAGDLEIPKDWFKKMERRKNVNQLELSEKEKAILKALASTIKPEYKETGFLDVIDDLANKMNVTFALDKTSLADAGVTSDTQVTLLMPRGITARTALRKILADVGLSYVVKNETIQIISEAKAKEMMTTRTYYVGNLLAGGMFNDAGIRFNPLLDQIQVAQNIKNIVALIEGTIDPQSWQSNGGPATITFHGPTMSLVIRQSAEVHAIMSGYSK